MAKASIRHRPCHLPIRFSELANTPHLPQANAFAKANGKYIRPMENKPKHKGLVSQNI